MLPLRVNDGPLANLDNAITGNKSGLPCSVQQFHVCPLVPVVVNVVRYLTHQNALRAQDAKSLPEERWKGVRKRIPVLFRGAHYKPKALVEILSLVLPLIGDMRRVVKDDVEVLVRGKHIRVVADHIRVEARVNVHPDDPAFAATQNLPRFTVASRILSGSLRG
jgi:hypothetical protein